MENKYDNEFVRKQLYDMRDEQFKDVSYEDFKDELDRTVESFHQQSMEHDSFKKEYNQKHKLCPICGAKEHSITLMAYILRLEAKEEYKDLNRCICSSCGDNHTKHDRVPEVQI